MSSLTISSMWRLTSNLVIVQLPINVSSKLAISSHGIACLRCLTAVHNMNKSLFFSEEDDSTTTPWIERSMIAQQSAFSSGEIWQPSTISRICLIP